MKQKISFNDLRNAVPRFRTVARIFRLVAISIACLVILFFILNWIFPVPDKIEYSTIITDSKGEVINAYLTSDQKWRMKTELNEISPLLRKTIIAKEDKYFYYHPGVNPFAIVRAFFKNIFRMKDHFRCKHHHYAGSEGIGAPEKEYRQ